MSASLESYLVKLYLDRDARRPFLDNPNGAAVASGLSAADVTSLDRIDGDGLELAARSFALERGRQAPRGLGARLGARLRRWRRTT